MTTWLTAKKAAKYIKEQNPNTMIGERTIKNLIKQGFPCLKIDSRTLVNVDTFEQDLKDFSTIKKETNKNENNSKIKKIKI